MFQQGEAGVEFQNVKFEKVYEIPKWRLLTKQWLYSITDFVEFYEKFYNFYKKTMSQTMQVYIWCGI